MAALDAEALLDPELLPAEPSPAHRSAVEPEEEPIRSMHPLIPTLFQRLLAVLLGIALMTTGIVDTIVYINRNSHAVGMDLSSPLAAWVETHTSPDAVFLSPPYHYNAFFLSGRMVFCGHSYYAWSAGHDTTERIRQMKVLYQGDGGDLEAFDVLVRDLGISYAIVDDGLRTSEEFPVDEAFFRANFPVAAAFPELGGLTVYDLRAVPD
jgi:hypothetical protein